MNELPPSNKPGPYATFHGRVDGSVLTYGPSKREIPSLDPDFIRPQRPRTHIRTVLLATDLGPISDTATQKALDLTASLGARLLVVNVIDQARLTVGRVSSRIDQVRADREPALLDIVRRARAGGVPAEFLLWIGEPGRSIVAAAEAEGADVIVVGTRALDRAGRFLLGSVSDHVVYHAGCPVLVCR